MLCFLAMALQAQSLDNIKAPSKPKNGGKTTTTPQKPKTTPAEKKVVKGFVDLGLPSGTLWAECNIGATSPEQYGNYYAWGETKPKEVYDWSTYRHCTKDGEQLKKYCQKADFGVTDSYSVLLSIDDVATVVFGNGAYIPKSEQWQELIDNTQNDWTEYNGVYGIKFTGINGKYIFLPAVGYMNGSDLYHAEEQGNYWFSSLYADNPYYAWYFSFDSDSQEVEYMGYRFDGISVRAVRARQN